MRISDWSSGVCSSDLFALCWIGHQQRRQFSLVAPIGALAVLMFAAAIALPTPQAIARVEASQSHKPFSEKELARLRNEGRSEEHTSELQSLMRISYAVFCLKKKTHKTTATQSLKQINSNHDNITYELLKEQ